MKPLEKIPPTTLLRRLWLFLTLRYWRGPKMPVEAQAPVDPFRTLYAENARVLSKENDLASSKRVREALLITNNAIVDAARDGLHEAKVKMLPLVADNVSGGDLYHLAFREELERRGFKVPSNNKYSGEYTITWSDK